MACSVHFSGLLRNGLCRRDRPQALKCFSAQPPMLLPPLVIRGAGRRTPMVTLLIATGALLIAIVSGVLLNPDEEREHAWPIF